MKTVYLVAMLDEIQGIFDLDPFELTKEFGFPVYARKNGNDVIIQTGIGKSNAAAAAQFALQAYPADRYVNTGLVGAFNHDLALAQVVEVTHGRFFDVDVTAFEYALGQIPKCELIEYELGGAPPQSKKILLVTGDTFLNSQQLRDHIVQHFNPDIVDMELTSIAHVFHLHDKLGALRSIKAVSDYADTTSHVDFYEVMTKALANLKEYLNHAKSE